MEWADEPALWRAVLTRAFLDASEPGIPLRERDEARAWLTRRGADFRIVCENAERDPVAVGERVDRLAAAGWEIAIEGRRASRPRALTGALAEAAPTIRALHAAGMPLMAIAKELQRRGVPTAKGGNWWPASVNRVLAMLAA